MSEEERPIRPNDWRTIVEHVPLVSVDLVVEHDGGVLLGKRENEPAKGEWFVPGGTVLKNESRREAVDRVAAEELGEPVVVEESLGTFEHFYDASEVDGVDSKHYVATAYRCRFKRDEPTVVGDDQHSDITVFRPPFEGVHPYVRRYLDAR
ncbi:NUDIX domain-containing protein [Halobaculum sp. WSA2]|uniref:NUDIX domain-containing protein n=1 Tax=Halobaculum saliterrae TaxID=2073113 RepID=A0A6B0SVY0_9EURY|nr:NUDIX domain-containing protein [Halobaculum saliterrae]MXR40783.1 NUDIX domain-containing protein [Halobaculum saliterrae]